MVAKNIPKAIFLWEQEGCVFLETLLQIDSSFLKFSKRGIQISKKNKIND